MLTRRPLASRVAWSTIPFHPLLIAAFPVLFLFVENAVQQVTLDPLWEPLAVAVGAAAALLLAGRLVVGEWRRGGLAASLVLIVFFGFGHTWNVIGGLFASPGWLVVPFAVFGLAGAVLIARGGRWVVPTTRILNGAFALLVVFNGVQVADFAIGAARALRSAISSDAVPLGEFNRRPDIYYIILDRYASGETLDEIYDYDNSPFLDSLEDRAFYVADESWANYFKTALSLVSSLSMTYLERDALIDADPPTFGSIHQALRDPLAVPATLKSIGYEYVHIANYWEPTATNVDADRSLRYEFGSEFSSALSATTALMLLQPPQQPDQDPETIEFPELARNHTLFAFDRLEEAAGRPGPTFVFAHILVPHSPYVFNADGTPMTDAQRRALGDKGSYLEQLKWANSRVLEAIDHLLDVPAGEEPIILLQADEGPFPYRFAIDESDFNWIDEATPEEIQQKFGILNAFHLPGVSPAEAGLYEDISPVNAFRIIFDAYFEARLPLLPDITYLSPDYDHKYDFVEYDRPG